MATVQERLLILLDKLKVHSLALCLFTIVYVVTITGNRPQLICVCGFITTIPASGGGRKLRRQKRGKYTQRFIVNQK